MVDAIEVRSITPADAPGEVSTVDVRLVHVDPPLNDPGVDAAVAAPWGERFAFDAWLPGWAGHDMTRPSAIACPILEPGGPSEGHTAPRSQSRARDHPRQSPHTATGRANSDLGCPL
jgi:hypothetical protein